MRVQWCSGVSGLDFGMSKVFFVFWGSCPQGPRRIAGFFSGSCDPVMS